jgi:hypothetical protein
MTTYSLYITNNVNLQKEIPMKKEGANNADPKLMKQLTLTVYKEA